MQLLNAVASAAHDFGTNSPEHTVLSFAPWMHAMSASSLARHPFLSDCERLDSQSDVHSEAGTGSFEQSDDTRSHAALQSLPPPQPATDTANERTAHQREASAFIRRPCSGRAPATTPRAGVCARNRAEPTRPSFSRR